MDQLTTPDPVARAKALGPELLAAADEIERTQSFPEPLLTHLHDARMFQLLLPRSVGGEQVAPGTYLKALIEIAKCEGSVGWNMFVGNSAALIAPFLPAESARAVFGDRRDACAWGSVNSQGAKAVDGGYLVNGTWDFASGSRQATWMGAHGPVTEPDGTLRLNERGVPLIRTWLFPKENAELLDNWNPVGLRGTCSQSYRIDNLFIPEAFSSTREYPEQRREPGPLYAFPQQSLYAVGVSGVALGIARGMLEAFRELSMKKVQRGRMRLADDAIIQAGYSRAEAKWGSSRAYLLETLADIYDAADDVEPIGVPDRARTRLACTNAIHASVKIADWVHREAGVSAIFPGSAFERRWRDMHTLSQQIQSRSHHYELVGKVQMGVPPDVFF
jgi:alkylation response protein AidB-like acyl-CoA dehydrogenase